MSAMLYRHWTPDAEPDEVMDWFSRELVVRGWTPRASAPFKSGLSSHSFFARETSDFTLRVIGRENPATVDLLASFMERRRTPL
jgi:hypothetical protein